jgi:capsular exopolysaccharide synthesis family protein
MSARKGTISRVTVPAQRLDYGSPGGDSARLERPLVSALMVIWRGRWIVLICTLLGLAYGIYKVATYVPVYRSSSTIYLKPPPLVLGPGFTNPNDSAGYLYTQCEIIHSTANLTSALSFPGVLDTDCLRNAEDPVAYLKNAVFAGPEKEGSLITVWMNSQKAQDAATIVNGVVGAYKQYQSEQDEYTYAGITKIITKRIDDLTEESKSIQKKLAEFRSEHKDAISDGMGKSGSQIQRMLADAQQKQMEFDLAVKEAATYGNNAMQLKHLVDEVNTRTHMQPDPDPVLDPSMVAEFNQNRSRLLGIMPKNPQFQTINARQKALEAELKRQNDAAVAKYNGYLTAELDAASKAVETLQAKADEEHKQLIGNYAIQSELDALNLQKSQTDEELKRLDGQLRPLANPGDMTSLSVKVLEIAKPALDTDGPKRSQTLMLGVVGGIMFGLGGALLLEMMEQRLRTVDEISKLLSPSVLGSVPRILPRPGPMDKNVLRAPWLRYLKSAWSMGSGRSAVSLKERGQIMHLQPRTDVAEAYRSIRTAIYFGLDGQPSKSILITSPSSGDGKTTLASNLAIAIAQTGRRVLLIDADCWHPAQSAIFELQDGPGLTEILEGSAILSDVVRKTEIPNLEILPCGKIPENPAELLGGQSWLDLLTLASEQYDQILIDSPPVVPITDARILSASVGATILVLRAEKSTRRNADDAFEALTSVGASILGMVVNDVARQSGGRSYQYYQYAADRGARTWAGRGISSATNGLHGSGNGGSGNGGSGNGNGNGHPKHLPGVVIDADITVDPDRR